MISKLNGMQIDLRLDLEIANDVMIAESWETDQGFSKDCTSFILKLYAAKLFRLRNAKWYELEVTTEEVVAVCQEVLMNVLLDIHQSIDCYDEKEQTNMKRYANKVRKFIQNNSQLLQEKD